MWHILMRHESSWHVSKGVTDVTNTWMRGALVCHMGSSVIFDDQQVGYMHM